MLKNKWIIPMLIILALIFTSCTNKTEKDDDLPPENLNDEENPDNIDENETDEDNIDGENDLEGEENNPDDNNEGSNMSFEDIKITVEEAYKQFTDKFANAKVNEIELERENNSYYYKIEGYDDKNEYELKIDGSNGEVLDDKTDPIGDREGEISLEDVKKIDKLIEKAGSEVEEEFSIDEWKLEIEDGKAVLKIEFRDDNNKEVEYEYDIKTEELIKKD